MLDARERAKTFRELEAGNFDLAVIGAGITGAGVAYDAALRGMRVALVDAGDYGRGTSSRSSKMIHGGLRYLAQGDTSLVKEAASERQVLRRIAPHLARMSQFVLPAPNRAAVAKLRAGLWAFERLGAVPSGERHVVWSSKELERHEPALRSEKLHGAVVYPEFLTNDARLTLANVRAAAAAGATALNYASVTQITGEDRADGLVCRSTREGDDLSVRIRARVILNATGPWVDQLRNLESADAPARLTLTKGVHVVLPHALIPVSHTVILRAADRRSVFAVPRDGLTYLGTTDTFFRAAEVWPPIDPADVEYLFQAATANLNIEPLSFTDVIAAWSGIRPLIAQAGKSPSEISRRDEVWTGPRGVMSVAGGKLSAYRAMAHRIVDSIAERLGRNFGTTRTDSIPLPGGDFDRAALAGDPHLTALGAAAQRLIDLYGSEAITVAQDGGDVAAEARQAVIHEGALRLEDYWLRRSARAWFTGDGGMADLASAAAAMGALLHWDSAQQAREISACHDLQHISLAFAAANSKEP